ncbi:MAG: hypothetical protein ACD_75C02499G0004 [uncultured bacterium]|nr:MAG: hypothetical protein ACD_75C02499G0004 [uncultured bacterium]
MEVDGVPDDIGSVLRNIGEVGIGIAVIAEDLPFLKDRVAEAEAAARGIFGIVVVFAFGVEQIQAPGKRRIVQVRIGIAEIIPGAVAAHIGAE